MQHKNPNLNKISIDSEENKNKNLKILLRKIKVRNASQLIKVTDPSQRKHMRVKALKKKQSKLQNKNENTVGITGIIAVMQSANEIQSSIGIKRQLGNCTSNKKEVQLDSVSERDIYFIEKG